MADAKAQLEQAKLDWERAQELFKNDDISKAQYDQYRMRFDSTAAALRQAEEHLALVVEGPRKEDIEAARAQVASAQAALGVSEANRWSSSGAKKTCWRTCRSKSSPRAGGHHPDADQRHMAYSPIDGVVLVKSAEVGEVLAAGTTVVTIGDHRSSLAARLHQRDGPGRVKLGAPAKLTTDSYPGKIYTGPRLVHRVRGRIHSQADSDQARSA